jgi:hypothetical protein
VQVREPVQAEQGVTQLVDDVPERPGVLLQDGPTPKTRVYHASLTDRSVTVTATCEMAGMVPEKATMIS